MLKILKDQSQIEDARRRLNEIGADSNSGWRRWLFTTLYTIRYRKKPENVALNKSWDVLEMVNFVEEHCPNKEISIYEMGSYNSEICVSLWNRGYRSIRAADLNPKGICINFYGNAINFVQENFYQPNVPDESLDLILSLSVIEHGWDQERFLEVCQKLLKPGGIALFSTDYHKEKLSIPEDYRLFNLTYMIFSQEEIQTLLNEAPRYGLELVSTPEWSESRYPINFLGHDFTFIVMALRKKQ